MSTSATPSPCADLVIVSPHRDDAAFSCGILLHAALATRSVRIVNIFTRSSYAPFAPAVESQGIAAVTPLRAAEDTTFLDLLRPSGHAGHSLTMTDLALLDAPWRLHLPTADVLKESQDRESYEHEVGRLALLLQPHLQGAHCVLLPLGLGGRGLEGHIDHRITRDAGLRSATPGNLAFYEDLPYAANMLPADRDAAISAFAASYALRPFLLERAHCGPLKLSCAQCYPSQIDPTTMQRISVYSQQRGGEHLYAAASAQIFLQHLQDSTEPG